MSTVHDQHADTSQTDTSHHAVGQPNSSQGVHGVQGHQDVSRPSIDFAKLRDVRLKDYAIRFAFGGTVSVLAALIGVWTSPRFGGVFTAFPAILLASLTLIGEKDGREQSAEDAEGGVLGAVAFVAAAFIALTVTRVAGIISLLASLCLWLALAVGLYLICTKLGLLRTYTSGQQHQQKSSAVR